MKIKIDLTKLVTYSYSTYGAVGIGFHIVSAEGLAVTTTDLREITISVNIYDTKSVYVFYSDLISPTYSYTNNNVTDLAFDEEEIIIEYDVLSYGNNSQLEKLIRAGVVTFIEEKQNVLITYRLNSEKDVVNKSLDFVTIIVGKFRDVVDLMNPVVDVDYYILNNPYNYIYITSLRRYYYVTRIERISNALTRLYLHEDVLMTHKNLIKIQTAYIERQENDYDLDIVDNLLISDYDKEITKTTVTPTNDIFPSTQADEDTRLSFIVTVVS